MIFFTQNTYFYETSIIFHRAGGRSPMMPSKELKDVLLDSSDVTALSSGDRVLISDINGVPKRIDRNTFLKFGSSQTKTVTPGATGWLRVATVGFSSSGIIKVAKTWGATSPAAIIFAYCIHCNGRFFLQCLSRLHDDGMFAKIRVVKKHNTGGFLDVYAPITGNEKISVDLIGSLDEISFGNSSNADIPEGYSAVEFTPANWGGVNAYCSNNYAIPQKGGLRDDADEGTYQRPSEGEDDGRDGGQRLLPRFGQCYPSGLLFRRGCDFESSREYLRNDGIPCIVNIPISSDSHTDWMYISKGRSGQQPHRRVAQATAFAALTSGKEVVAA